MNFYGNSQLFSEKSADILVNHQNSSEFNIIHHNSSRLVPFFPDVFILNKQMVYRKTVMFHFPKIIQSTFIFMVGFPYLLQFSGGQYFGISYPATKFMRPIWPCAHPVVSYLFVKDRRNWAMYLQIIQYNMMIIYYIIQVICIYIYYVIYINIQYIYILYIVL